MGAPNIADIDNVGRFYSLVSRSGDRKTVIVGHHNPDGDCIGCLTGMEAWIESAFGKTGFIVLRDAELLHSDCLERKTGVLYLYKGFI